MTIEMVPPLAPVYFLLVDDREENLLSLEALLRREGLVLLKTTSGAQALELLLHHDIALALLDVQMPEMDGFELAELMRGPERTRHVPIIFLTAGNADTQRRFRGYEAGAVDFIHKPIESDIMRSKAQVFFDLYRQRQQVAAQRDSLQAAQDENARLLAESRQHAEALRQADQRKDEFLATLAHELRNPLAPIRNGLQILRMNPAKETSDEIRDMMDRQLTHMVRLIDDLLDVSRISKGKIELRREKISLKACIDAAVEASQPLIHAARHDLTIDIPENVMVDADETRLSQIINNLLNNAAKYTPEGGMLMLATHRVGDRIQIIVQDNGLGIPSDMLPKVFELFTQVNQNLDRAQGGLGIGLALVKQLAEMHEGHIYVESAGLGKGSTFTLELPIADEMADAVYKEAASEKEDSTRQLSILVVDDNIASAKTLGWSLEMIGHRYKLCFDGIAALDVARAFNPDVILLDIGLPVKNGYEICRELRADPQFKNTVIIAQTGWGQERDRQMARDAGFDHHLIKPVNFDELSALIKSIQAGNNVKLAAAGV